jgi:hypothetical protein
MVPLYNNPTKNKIGKASFVIPKIGLKIGGKMP